MRKKRVKIPFFDDGIAFDDRRRLRNALLALADLEPGWMWWVEKNIPKWENLVWKRRMIERHARILMTRRYQFIGCRHLLAVIYGDFYFTDDGNLKLYK